MSITQKPIPVALQRNASALPCDGVKRFKVGKKLDLTYTEARAEILADGPVAPVGKGYVTRSQARRLEDLNRAYFRCAQPFISKAIEEAQAKQDYKAKHADLAPSTPEEAPEPVSNEPLRGLNPNVAVLDENPVPAQATLPVEMPKAVITMEVGDKRHICDLRGESVGALSRNKAGYRCVIDSQEVRSRNAASMAQLITTALGNELWTLVPLKAVA